MKTIVYFLVFFSASIFSFGQDSYEDSSTVFNFKQEVDLMVDSLHMSDSTEIQFFEVYNEYGETMKNAYENRTGWIDLYQTYKWAVGVRDEKMFDILSEEQYIYFVQRQKEIEKEARANR